MSSSRTSTDGHDGYEYSIEDCDVEDKNKLERYRKKRSEWISWLDGDREHSVWGQIQAMLWSDALFWLVNEARGIALRNGKPSCLLNGPLAAFTDQGYVATQVLAIQRLNDARPDVISLRRVLRDIKDHHCLITRENHVSHDGLPYDYQRVAHELRTADTLHDAIEQCTELPARGPKAFFSAGTCHHIFDGLSKTTPDNRQRDDRILKSFFKGLETRLSESGVSDIKILRDKFFAHAADACSRQTLTSDQRDVTLNKLADCQRAICEVAHVISSRLLWHSDHGLLPARPNNLLKHLEQPWLPDTDLEALGAAWKRHVEEVERWTDGADRYLDG